MGLSSSEVAHIAFQVLKWLTLNDYQSTFLLEDGECWLYSSSNFPAAFKNTLNIKI